MEDTVNSLVDYSDEWRVIMLDRMGFKEDPFSVSADPRYLYLGTEHLGVYRQLQGVVTRRRGLAMLTGGMGMGKSSLARRLMQIYYEKDNIELAFIDTGSFKTPMSAAQTISSAFPNFNIGPQRSYDRQMEELKHAIIDANERGKNVVLLLDDAQRMTRDALEAIHELYNFDYNEKLIQVLLFGQSELRPLVNSYPAVRERMFFALELFPMVIESAYKMVEYRVRTAGREQFLIDIDAFTILYEVSRGIPRRIVQLCALGTDILMEKNTTFITKEIIQEIINRAKRTGILEYE
ncbi:MAG: AAA family ATPase [Anaerolineaceae bacterium]|jgi:general secretion pathway protein A|nr:AAA family ATPase [Anaerolineaceae bacterium]